MLTNNSSIMPNCRDRESLNNGSRLLNGCENGLRGRSLLSCSVKSFRFTNCDVNADSSQDLQEYLILRCRCDEEKGFLSLLRRRVELGENLVVEAITDICPVG